VRFEDMGMRDYKEAWDFQESIFQRIVDRKLSKRLNPETPDNTENHLLFVEHPHVYTLGKSGDEKHLLLSEEQLKKVGASFYPINRGGDITYHGPGQIVGYPIFDLELFFTDIHLYLRKLEEVVIQLLQDFNIEAERSPGFTGVWIDANTEKARKICAMGVKCSRWVTMHGIALNVSNELSFFNHIIPCGIEDKSVTNLSNEATDANITMKDVKHLFSGLFAKEFEANITIELMAQPLPAK
jgi:lipoyl(octanoyl) transferase